MKYLIKPRVTEKSYAIIEATKATGSTYTFQISPRLAKGDVKKVVEKQFNVTVEAVNIVNTPGKARRFKGIPGRTSDIKKAIVRLKKGDTIPAFDIEDAAGDKE